MAATSRPIKKNSGLNSVTEKKETEDIQQDSISSLSVFHVKDNMSVQPVTYYIGQVEF